VGVPQFGAGYGGAGVTLGGVAKGALSAAPSVLSSTVGKAKAPGLGKRPAGVDVEGMAALERDRLRRQASSSRASILTGPTGAPGKALVGRTILSGG
jgi:hypothetical protein